MDHSHSTVQSFFSQRISNLSCLAKLRFSRLPPSPFPISHPPPQGNRARRRKLTSHNLRLSDIGANSCTGDESEFGCVSVNDQIGQSHQKKLRLMI